jgi:3-isopropylmalate dehydrogenase
MLILRSEKTNNYITMKLNIAVLPGDGIGPEIVEQALNVTKEICKKFGHELTYETALTGLCEPV